MTHEVKVQVDEIMEQVYERLKASNMVTSNLMSEVKKTLDTHTLQISEVSTTLKNVSATIEKIGTKMDSMTEWKGSVDGSKSATVTTIGIVGVLIVGLIGVIYTFQTQRLDKVEAKVDQVLSK